MFEKIYYNNVALLNKILETSQLGLTHDIPQNISSYILDKVSPEILSYYLSLRQTYFTLNLPLNTLISKHSFSQIIVSGQLFFVNNHQISVSGSYPDPDRENFILFFRSGSGSKDPLW